MRKTIQQSKWLLAAVLLMLTASGCGSDFGNKSRKAAAIEKIEKIKSEKQIGLVEYEVSKIVKAQDARFFKLKKRAIICACKAYLKAGIDLSGLNPMTDIVIDPDETMITLTLPKPTLLSLNMPINEVDVLYEKATLSKGFTVTDLNELLRQGEDQIRKSVPELGILKDAELNARLFFEPLFRHLGFTTVVVLFKEDETKA